jgi:hypothetical protein
MPSRKLIKHNKLKNTGILFELLIRQVTNDFLTKGDSPSVKILKKYFANTELAKEQRLYNLVNTNEKLNEIKADHVLHTIIDLSKKIDYKKVNNEKYNLIKEIKKHYDLNAFFKNKINNYKTSAAIYTLLESNYTNEYTDPKQIVDNKITILEALLQKAIINEENEDIKEFLQESKDIRILTYKILIDKFNEKYDSFSKQQKLILKEYINNINDASKLKEVANKHFDYVKLALDGYTDKIEDKVTKIKLTETIKLIQPIKKNEHPKEEHLLNLFQYYELLDEVKKVL